jgi:hypothetical protein
MYLTYEQYQQYGGTLDETTFSDYEFEARSQIDWYTFNRLKNEDEYPEAVTRLMYRIIKMLELKAQSMGLTAMGDNTNDSNYSIASRSNDGVSVSYNVVSASEVANNSKKEIANAIKMYLQDVTNSLGQKVLYRGLYPGE